MANGGRHGLSWGTKLTSGKGDRSWKPILHSEVVLSLEKKKVGRQCCVEEKEKEKKKKKKKEDFRLLI